MRGASTRERLQRTAWRHRRDLSTTSQSFYAGACVCAVFVSSPTTTIVQRVDRWTILPSLLASLSSPCTSTYLYDTSTRPRDSGAECFFSHLYQYCTALQYGLKYKYKYFTGFYAEFEFASR